MEASLPTGVSVALHTKRSERDLVTFTLASPKPGFLVAACDLTSAVSAKHAHNRR